MPFTTRPNTVCLLSNHGCNIHKDHRSCISSMTFIRHSMLVAQLKCTQEPHNMHLFYACHQTSCTCGPGIAETCNNHRSCSSSILFTTRSHTLYLLHTSYLMLYACCPAEMYTRITGHAPPPSLFTKHHVLVQPWLKSQIMYHHHVLHCPTKYCVLVFQPRLKYTSQIMYSTSRL